MDNQAYQNGGMPYHTSREQEPTMWSLYADNIRMQERLVLMDRKVQVLCRQMQGMQEMKASYNGIRKAFWIVVSSALGLIVLNIASKVSISM